MFGIINDPTSKVQVVTATWSCFIDQILIENPPLYSALNQQTFCEQLQMASGPHELTVNISASSTTLFNFDSITYDTSDTTELDSAVVVVKTTDQTVAFGPGWVTDSGFNVTGSTGSKMSFKFNGPYHHNFAIA